MTHSAEATDAAPEATENVDATDDADAPEPTHGAGRTDPAIRSARLAALAFGAYVAAAVPILMFGIGRYWWFFRDDWFFITDRDLSAEGLFEDHNGHWTTAPILVFRFLFATVGLRSYAPYKITVVIAHLVVAVFLRAIMRRYGVGPWLASVIAGALVLFGSGREDILWAFQVGFTGSIALLFVQWWLADRPDAPLDRRDALGAACGVLAVTAGSPAIPLIAALSFTLLVRRGWRAAVVHAAPSTAAYLAWSLIVQPNRTALGGAEPPVSALTDWVVEGVGSTFDDLTGHRWAAIALGLTVVVGTVLALLRSPATAPRHSDDDPTWRRTVEAVRQRLRPVIGPIAMFGATVVFILLASQRAWIFGPSAASASRYIYAYAAFTLPLIALSIQELGRRWRFAAPLLALLVVIGVPENYSRLEDSVFGPGYHAHQRDLFTNVTRAPGFDDAPADLLPDPDPFNSPGLTVGFFRQALEDGKLPRLDGPIPSVTAAELQIRLGLLQAPGTWPIPPCTPIETDRINLSTGTTFILQEPVHAKVTDHDGAQFPTRLDPGGGPVVESLVDDLDLEILGADGGPANICVLD